MLHFYLTDGRVFVPFKLRESRISGDACYGYIELDQVARLIPGKTFDFADAGRVTVEAYLDKWYKPIALN